MTALADQGLSVDVEGPPMASGFWTSQITRSFPSQVSLQLRKQAFSLVTSPSLLRLSLVNLGRGSPTQATGILAPRAAGPAWLSQVNFISQVDFGEFSGCGS